MDATLLVFLYIALGACTILMIVAAVVLIRAGSDVERITKTVESMQRDVHQMKEQALPVLAKTSEALDRANTSLRNPTVIGLVNCISSCTLIAELSISGLDRSLYFT